MKVLAVDFHMEPVLFEGCTTMYRVVSDRSEGRLNIFFDENMCIDLNSTDFIDDLRQILDSYHFTIYNDRNVHALASKIEALLHETEAQGYLWRGPMFEIMSKYNSMLLLSDQGYAMARAYLDRRSG